MNEVDWLDCQDPHRLLQSILREPTGFSLFLSRFGLFSQYRINVPSERKIRLYACACCRCLPAIENDTDALRALAIGELFADGSASKEQLFAAQLAMLEASCADIEDTRDIERNLMAMEKAPQIRSNPAATLIFLSLGNPHYGIEGTARLGMATDVAHLSALHCIFGNPFRQEQELELYRLCKVEAFVYELAQRIYDQRRFMDLPQVANMLSNAGCEAHQLIDHLRSPMQHFHGCWALDMILGKL
jgi:hypothetical protein